MVTLSADASANNNNNNTMCHMSIAGFRGQVGTSLICSSQWSWHVSVAGIVEGRA